jgi:hypothetical protein
MKKYITESHCWCDGNNVPYKYRITQTDKNFMWDSRKKQMRLANADDDGFEGKAWFHRRCLQDISNIIVGDKDGTSWQKHTNNNEWIHK